MERLPPSPSLLLRFTLEVSAENGTRDARLAYVVLTCSVSRVVGLERTFIYKRTATTDSDGQGFFSAKHMTMDTPRMCALSREAATRRVGGVQRQCVSVRREVTRTLHIKIRLGPRDVSICAYAGGVPSRS